LSTRGKRMRKRARSWSTGPEKGARIKMVRKRIYLVCKF